MIVVCMLGPFRHSPILHVIRYDILLYFTLRSCLTSLFPEITPRPGPSPKFIQRTWGTCCWCEKFYTTDVPHVTDRTASKRWRQLYDAIQHFICHKQKTLLNGKKTAQRRRKHCALAVERRSQNFCSAADPLPGGAGRPKFNQMVTTFTYRPSLVKIDARNFELSWQQTHKQTHRQDRLQ